MTDPIKLIKDDHRHVEALFKEYEELGEHAFTSKRTVALEITSALTQHAEMEEIYLYPRLEEKFNKEGDKMVEEAYAEHAVAKQLVGEIELLDTEDPQFDAKIMVLKENIEHHVKEEENEILPKMKKELSKEELIELGEELQNFKSEEAE